MDDPIDKLIRGHDPKAVARMIGESGIDDPDGTLAASIKRMVNAASIPRAVQAGYCLEMMRDLILSARTEGELSVARAAIKDYWQIVKDISDA